MIGRPTRRAVLGHAAAAAAGFALPVAWASRAGAQTGPAPGPEGLRLRRIAVDTSRVAAIGSPAAADLLARDLTRHLRQVFGDLMAPKDAGDAVLLARISSLYLTSFVGGRAHGRRGEGSGNDSLDGVGILSRGSGVLSETPVLSVLDPAYSGAWYLPDIDERRIDAIARHFAYWLRREMGV
jgi:outer membrane receptor protein involved in Fe transport